MMVEEKPAQLQLFTLRVWVEDVGDGRSEIRGQIKHIPTGETTFFRKWSSLKSFLMHWFEKKQHRLP